MRWSVGHQTQIAKDFHAVLLRMERLVLDVQTLVSEKLRTDAGTVIKKCKFFEKALLDSSDDFFQFNMFERRNLPKWKLSV